MTNCDCSVLINIPKRLKTLNKNFGEDFDFHSHESKFMLFSDPFHCDPENAPANLLLVLIELQESSHLKSSFHDLPWNNFYSLVPDSTYPNLGKHAFRMATLFGSTYSYICEKTFSIMHFNKSK